MCVWSLSSIQLFATPWTATLQAPLSMGFPKQRYWSGLPFSLCRRSSWPRDQTCISCIGGWIFMLLFFTTEPPRKSLFCYGVTLQFSSPSCFFLGGGMGVGQEWGWGELSVTVILVFCFLLQWLCVVPLHFLDRGGYFRWFEMYSLSAPSSVSVK